MSQVHEFPLSCTPTVCTVVCGYLRTRLDEGRKTSLWLGLTITYFVPYLDLQTLVSFHSIDKNGDSQREKVIFPDHTAAVPRAKMHRQSCEMQEFPHQAVPASDSSYPAAR